MYNAGLRYREQPFSDFIAFMRHFYVFFCIAGIAALLGGSSCNIINPSEPVPTYVRIDSFGFTGNPAVTGSNSHKITNVYVYFNNAPVGIFDLPATFPVIAKEKGTLTVLPGIYYDGLSGYISIYELYQGKQMELDPQPGGQVSFNPVTSYNPGVLLQSNDEFEGPGVDNSFVKLSGDTSIHNVFNSEVFEGNGSGLIYLRPGKDSATQISRVGRALATGKQNFLELDFKGNMPLVIGVSTTLNTGGGYSAYFIGLKPRSEWGKVYIGLDEFIGVHQGYDYKIMLHTEKPAGQTDGYVYVDNVKVISFK